MISVQGIKELYAIDSHTIGEPTRIILSGFPEIPGDTMMEKKNRLQNEYDHIRKALMNEPRGHQHMFGAIVFPTARADADLGAVFMDGGGYLNMCGHGTIGLATVAVEEKLVAAVEPYTELNLETPAGVVHTRVHVENGKVRSVSFTNVPAFLYCRDVDVDVPGLGSIRMDIAYGGNFFALVDAVQLGLTLSPENAETVSSMGKRIRDAVRAQIEVRHPLLPDIRSVDLVEFFGPALKPEATLKNAVFFGRDQLDRSPCGTGTSAKLAALYAKDELKLGEPFVCESILGTCFTGRVLDETMVGPFPAVIPEITGRAFITGRNRLVFEEDDPFQFGFAI